MSVAIASTPSFAGGFYSPYQSGTAIGAGFAGSSARTDDASFFFFNPAVIGEFSKRQTHVDARAFFVDASIHPNMAQAPLPSGANVTSDGASGDMVADALALGSVTVVPLENGWTLGLGSSAPFASAVETRENWAGRYHLIESRLVGLNATAALAWQMSPALTVSAGLQVQRFETEFQNAAVIPAAVPFETTISMKGFDWGVGTVAGLLWKPTEATRIGVGWRSAMSHRIRADIKAAIPAIPVERVQYTVDLPQTASMGLEHRLTSDLRLFAEIAWVDWSSFKGFDIAFDSGRPNEVRPIQWQDTWAFGIGAGVRISPDVEVTFGVSYDTAASPTGSGTTLSPDAEKIIAGAGALLQVPKLGRISISYAHVFAFDAPVSADNASGGTFKGKLVSDMDILSLGYTMAW